MQPFRIHVVPGLIPGRFFHMRLPTSCLEQATSFAMLRKLPCGLIGRLLRPCILRSRASVCRRWPELHTRQRLCGRCSLPPEPGVHHAALPRLIGLVACAIRTLKERCVHRRPRYPAAHDPRDRRRDPVRQPQPRHPALNKTGAAKASAWTVQPEQVQLRRYTLFVAKKVQADGGLRPPPDQTYDGSIKLIGLLARHALITSD